MQIKTWRGSKALAITWIILMSILFFLPGSAFPKEGWLDEIFFDKWVHFGLFAVLLFLWRFQFPKTAGYDYVLIALAAIYGLGVEVIQHYWIPNRSFDLFDVVADTIGGVAGLWLWAHLYKKIDPCRNRGRNQN